jgi:4-aminobutyrate aminotransferase-like enzyme/Ser/Thr protein kinase RdoA (MazF antagonist)
MLAAVEIPRDGPGAAAEGAAAGEAARAAARAPDPFEAKPLELAPAAAERIAAERFGIAASAEPLASERDLNFRLRDRDGRDYVLELANPAEDPAVVDLETRALLHVAACDPELPVPRVLRTAAGALSSVIEARDGRRSIARLLSYLPGTALGSAPRGAECLRDVGATLARLGHALRGFFHPAADRELPWDLKRAQRLRARVREIEPAGLRRLADESLARFEARVLPRLPGLRAQVIHNDVSRSNTLVDARGERVVGILDFGDLVHAPLVDDVAVTVTEALLDAADPLGAALAVVEGYAGVEELRAEERALLFDLVAARLAMAAAISAWRAARHPENRAYIAGDDGQVGALLERLPALERELRAGFGDAGAASGPAGALPRPARRGGPGDAATLPERRARVLGPSLTHFYERPLHLVRAEGVFVYDASGRAYLDAYNNAPHVGHCRPEVVAAIARQAARINTNTRYLHELVVEYAERLGALLPDGLGVCTFVCSGSEANDLAWRLAKAHTGHAGALVVEGAYHGTTDAVHVLSPGGRPAGALARHVRAIPAPDGHRGPHRRGEPRLGERYAALADAAIASLRADGLAPAAFFVDPLLSSSGILPPPEGWLRAVFERVRAAGGICVADEVQTGLGRTGDRLFGFEAHGVVPDVVTLGKSIGNGHPLAAVVTRPEIARSFARAEGEFFSTYGGNPVSCAAGLAVLDVLERERLRERAREVGARLRGRLEDLARHHALVGDVRGAGLFLGVELVRDRATLEPATAEARAVVNRLRDAGVLVGTEGPHANVVKIRPPLVFGEADADRLVAALAAVLGAR